MKELQEVGTSLSGYDIFAEYDDVYGAYNYYSNEFNGNRIVNFSANYWDLVLILKHMRKNTSRIKRLLGWFKRPLKYKIIYIKTFFKYYI